VSSLSPCASRGVAIPNCEPGLELDQGAGGNISSVAVEKIAHLGRDQLAIIVNGSLATIVGKLNQWKSAWENTVQVAPGMDILLALGVNWIKYDKEAMDVKGLTQAVAAAT
jgi:hypothetical protein